MLAALICKKAHFSVDGIQQSDWSLLDGNVLADRQFDPSNPSSFLSAMALILRSMEMIKSCKDFHNESNQSNDDGLQCSDCRCEEHLGDVVRNLFSLLMGPLNGSYQTLCAETFNQLIRAVVASGADPMEVYRTGLKVLQLDESVVVKSELWNDSKAFSSAHQFVRDVQEEVDRFYDEEAAPMVDRQIHDNAENRLFCAVHAVLFPDTPTEQSSTDEQTVDEQETLDNSIGDAVDQCQPRVEARRRLCNADELNKTFTLSAMEEQIQQNSCSNDTTVSVDWSSSSSSSTSPQPAEDQAGKRSKKKVTKRGAQRKTRRRLCNADELNKTFTLSAMEEQMQQSSCSDDATISVGWSSSSAVSSSSSAVSSSSSALPRAGRQQSSEQSEEWLKVPKKQDGLKRHPWTVEESARLYQAVQRYGKGDWTNISSHFSSRNNVACKDRWRVLKNGKPTSRQLMEDFKRRFGPIKR